MIELIKHGMGFHLYDHTDITIPGYPRYLYHFVNKGGQHGVDNYVDCHHTTQAMVSAPSYELAIDLLNSEELGGSHEGYTFEVNLVGLDLMSEEGDRILFHETKRPIW